MSDDDVAARAWDGVFDPEVDLSFTVRLSTEVSPWSMIEHPGLERWNLELRVEDCGPGADRWAVAAEVNMFRADLRESPDFVYSVCETAFGLEQVAHDIDQCSREHDQVLMVRMAVVDPFWRGRGLGPALVWQAARRLECPFVALEPSAFNTRVVAGRCELTDWEPSPNDMAREKVRQSWRRAGFQPLTGTTWFAHPASVMEPYRASVHLLEEASGFLGTEDTDHWLTQRFEGRQVEAPTLRVPPLPRPPKRP